ncbi:MAG: hypothetical protein ACYCZJ_05440 [Sulfuriferula sp.]
MQLHKMLPFVYKRLLRLQLVISWFQYRILLLIPVKPVELGLLGQSIISSMVTMPSWQKAIPTEENNKRCVQYRLRLEIDKLGLWLLVAMTMRFQPHPA